MSYYEWAMIMHETYAKQNDMEQAEYYYNMAQSAKKRGENNERKQATSTSGADLQ